jgi:hypothetical protein
VIDRNTVVFNEGFNQTFTRSGGGIYVGGTPPPAGGVTAGAGSVRISNNLIQGNQAASGDGGGLALSYVNGTDVLGDVAQRHRVRVVNNVIVNNEAALAGGGISLQDAAYVDIVHDTIARNDSLATAGGAFTSGPTQSVPQPAGIVSRGHTPALAQALGAGFSNPTLANSIVWQNRSFYFGPVAGGVQIPGANPALPTYGLIANPTSPYWDLGVLGGPTGAQLAPAYSVLTSTAGYAASNVATAPAFVAQYFNGSRRPTLNMPEHTIGIQVPAAFDEGGNFIRPLFGPLTLNNPAGGAFFGNYHVTAGVRGAALNAIFNQVPDVLQFDFDRQPRAAAPSQGPNPHRGADEKLAPPAPTTPIPPQFLRP